VAKRRKRKRRPSLLLLIALAMLIAGFIVRRTLAPLALHRLTHRERQQPDVSGAGSDPRLTDSHPSQDENLSDSDRLRLDNLVHDKTR
jgi:hypothetical protein